MNSNSRRAIFLVAAAAVLLTVLNLWFAPRVALNNSATSFGVGSSGYKAAYEVLRESGVPVRRSYVAPAAAPPRSALWMVEPAFLIAGPRADDAAGRMVLEWVRAGGTAVVFGDPQSDWRRLDVARAIAAGKDAQVVQGDFAPRPRRLELAGAMHFQPAAGKAAHDGARVRLASDGEPFALELRLGAGRLIAVADGRFMLNANLGEADASVLLADLVRALGPPVFDEYFHGLVQSRSLTLTLLRSRVTLALGAGLLLGLLWVGERRSWPPRGPARRAEEPAPSIDAFIDSLGVLYAGARDPAAAFRAYRAGFLHRLRRQLWPHGEFSERLLLERLARDRFLPAEARRWLFDGAPPASESELLRAARALESYTGPG